MSIFRFRPPPWRMLHAVVGALALIHASAQTPSATFELAAPDVAEGISRVPLLLLLDHDPALERSFAALFARDRLVLRLKDGIAGTATALVAPLHGEMRQRGYGNLDVLADAGGWPLALALAEAEPKFIRRVEVVAAASFHLPEELSTARFKLTTRPPGQTESDADALFPVARANLDLCHCERP